MPHLDALPDFDAAGAFADELFEWGKAPMAENEKTALPADADPRHAQRVEQRRLVELELGDNAAAKLKRLPRKGEAVHVRMDGSFNGFDFIPALLALLKPATIRTLHVASLSFNRRVGDRLLELVDAHQVGRCVFLSSAMFEGKERHLVDWMSAELAQRKGRLIVARNHCKLLLAHTSDGRRLVMEGSQNLRTCSCYEQCVFCDDARLYWWHRRFIERLEETP